MRGKRVAVVGDIMLDEWLWGDVSRISPEAPVPVVEVRDQSYTLGGAGNVANNLAALGARVHLVGVIGDDAAGARVLELCKQLRIDTGGTVVVRSRPTTQKTRIVAHNQQVVRADREHSAPLDKRASEHVRAAIAALDGAIDGAVVSDYGKGLIAPPLVRALLGYKRPIVVAGDPKPQNLAAFNGVELIAPNTAEAASAAQRPVRSDADLSAAGRDLLRRTGCRYVLVTRGEQGMTLFSRTRAPFTVPAIARQVYDVSGAGDTVISALTLALVAGATIEHAVALASIAAGVVVEKLGTATATPKEITHFAEHEGVRRAMPFAGKKAARARR
jgi:D-beta-D-heptose 7-phosphate kinase/D-beta-D-heptose 1-phosphate adenosyltransferase